MSDMRKDLNVVAGCVAVAVVAIGGLAWAVAPDRQTETAPPPAPVTVDTRLPAPSTTTLPPTTLPPATTTTQPAPVAPDSSRCPQHYVAALNAGWTDSEWDTLDRIMWRESRCDPFALNDSYLRGGRDNSYGLTQINLLYHDDWVLPQVGDANALFDPTTNLDIARQLWEWLEEHNQCGWSAWRGTCD